MNASSESRFSQLEKIYRAAVRWAGDPQAVPRNISAIQPDSRLAVIGEAVGPRTLRLSGVSYFDTAGRLGRTGKALDQILSRLGYTIFPPQDVNTANGPIKASSGAGRKTVYCTDLCPVFPGYKSGKMQIQQPSAALIRSALAQNFLQKELAIVQPTVILLLGVHAYKSFHRYLLQQNTLSSLTFIANHMDSTEFSTYRGALVLPLLHPSPASPVFSEWFKTFPDSASCRHFIRLVTERLN